MQKNSMEETQPPRRYNLFERVVNRRSWYFFACFVFYLAGSLLLRAILFEFFTQGSHHSKLLFAHVLATGIHCDAAVALCLFAPFAAWLQLVPERIFKSKAHQLFLSIGVALYLIAQLFSFVVEFEFFDEFNSRFNTVAVDYLIYPQEVFVNIWQSYPVVKILAAVILAGTVLAFFMNGRYRRYVDAGSSLANRLIWIAIYTGLLIVALALQVHEPGEFNHDRVVYEIALNGSEAFFDAAVTRELHYPSFYPTLDRGEAYSRTRKLLDSPGAVFDSQWDSIERKIPGGFSGKPKNVVILLIESFGSEFWGSLGRKEPTLTPEMDALSQEGLLFTNLFASGNRTVRGMEGALASFPPLPGDSIVKRLLSDNVSTIARTLKQTGYTTLFMYGGRGVFDGMRSFTLRNGYERFIEQKDFPKPTFTTIWGVCDEDLYRRGIEELRELHKSDKPFFVTFLSVSNHKPYTYPPGRIPENPNHHSRSHAVKYTDWALGEFFRLAKKEAFYNDTLFVVMADHGARVYGSQKIPITSYKIPLLIVSPLLKKTGRVDMLGGTLDVGPTVMGLLGRPYQSVFFGQDLLRKNPATAWAVMNHNRDIGFYRNNRLVVLGLNKTFDFYEMSADRMKLETLSTLRPEDEELKRDATALFQVADDLYTNQKYYVKKPQ